MGLGGVQRGEIRTFSVWSKYDPLLFLFKWFVRINPSVAMYTYVYKDFGTERLF